MSEVTCTHVAIDKILYNCKTTTEAVDLCFKVFHTLCFEYSEGCSHIWSYLQLYLYDIQKEERPLVAASKISSFNTSLKSEEELAIEQLQILNVTTPNSVPPNRLMVDRTINLF